VRNYVLRRLLLFVPTLVGASLALFILMRLLPGDLALLVLLGPEGEGTATAEEVATMRAKLGTDRPIHEQYLRWVGGLVRLDLGVSLVNDRPVADALARRFGATFELATISTALSALMGLSAGVGMAMRRDSPLDYALRVITISGLALPNFFVATLLILVLVTSFNWFPPIKYVTLLEDPFTKIQQIIWPVLILAYAGAAVTARLVRSTMLEILGEDYIRTARSKGLRERSVLIRHALRNAVLPALTFIGVVYVGSLNGTVVLEYMFVIPGIGSGLVDALTARDYPTVQGFLTFIVLLVLTSNLVIDLLYGLVDPRITYQ
jgi:peptide/nickel transport system permease protein